jgi:MoxR-like ATPase
MSLSISRIIDLIAKIHSTNKLIAETGDKPKALCIEGKHGIGKTSLVKQAASLVGASVVVVNIGQLADIGDFQGFPSKQYEMLDASSNVHWVDEKLLGRAADLRATTRTRQSYATPVWVSDVHTLAASSNNGVIVVFDDVTRGNSYFMQALMQVLLEQEYQSWSLPANVTIVMTSNPDDGNYDVSSLDPAQADRYFNFHVEYSHEEFVQYLYKVNTPEELVAFIDTNPELMGKVSPRAVCRLFAILAHVKFDSTSLESVKDYEALAETLDPTFSAMLLQYLTKALMPVPRWDYLRANCHTAADIVKYVAGIMAGKNGEINNAHLNVWVNRLIGVYMKCESASKYSDIEVELRALLQTINALEEAKILYGSHLTRITTKASTSKSVHIRNAFVKSVSQEVLKSVTL